MRVTQLVLLLLVLLGAAARAEAHQVRYEGPHPIPAEAGGGYCQIDFPHVHVFEPQKPDVLYRNHEGGYAFVGDPVPYGYEGPKHAYYGPHPMQDERGDTEYCYIEGPHYHSLPPPVAVAPDFHLKGGVYFYSGHFPQTYYDARPRYARINTVYRPMVYARPVVVAPEANVVVEAQAPAVVVPAQAGVSVEAGVGFHAGVGVGVGGGVVVAGPPPPVVVVGRPEPVYVVHEHHPRTVFVEDRRRVEVVKVKEEKHEPHGHAWGRGW